MKNKDQEVLKNLYEDIYKKDYLRCDNPDEYDWQDFSDQKYSGGFSYLLIESFEKIATKPSKDGEEDFYEIVLRDGLKFTLRMNYISPNNTKNFIKEKEANASTKPDNDIESAYENFFGDGNVGSVCVIQFEDSEGRTRQTGEVGISSIELFGTLRTAIIDSMQQNKFKNLIGLMIRASNSEPKRIGLYQKMVEKYMKNTFPVVFIDPITEKGDGYTLIVARKA
jgi:hypothetical protein